MRGHIYSLRIFLIWLTGFRRQAGENLNLLMHLHTISAKRSCQHTSCPIGWMWEIPGICSMQILHLWPIFLLISKESWKRESRCTEPLLSVKGCLLYTSDAAD